MLIRSQEKFKLTPFNQQLCIRVDGEDCDIGYWEGETPYFNLLATYSSKGKAIKVLDMVCAAYENSLYCDHGFDCAANVQRPYIFVSNTVFQMPQDSEV